MLLEGIFIQSETFSNDEHVSKGWSLDCLVEIDLLPNNQRLSQFFSITRQFFGQRAEQVLQKNQAGLA